MMSSEDTTVDYDDLIEEFGVEVADMVAALSKDPRMIEPLRGTGHTMRSSPPRHMAHS